MLDGNSLKIEDNRMRLLLLCMAVFLRVACGGKTNQTAADTPLDGTQEVSTSTQDTSSQDQNSVSDTTTAVDLTPSDPGNAEPDIVVEVAEDISPEPPVDAATDPGTSQTGLPDLSTLELNGTLPPVALAAPEFEALNYDNGLRTQANLMGKPTVMWFFPFANTPG